MVDLNGTQSAIRAGYAPRSASVAAARLLANVKVSAEIQKGRERISKATGITQEAVLKELAKIGFANMSDYMRVGPGGDPALHFDELTPDQTAALSEVTVEDYTDGRGEDARDVRRVKFKLWDKRAALVDIGKHLGMFPNKTELTGPDGGPVQIIERVIVDPGE